MNKHDISRYLRIIRRTGAPIILTSETEEPVVLLPLDDYELLLESGQSEPVGKENGKVSGDSLNSLSSEMLDRSAQQVQVAGIEKTEKLDLPTTTGHKEPGNVSNVSSFVDERWQNSEMAADFYDEAVRPSEVRPKAGVMSSEEVVAAPGAYDFSKNTPENKVFEDKNYLKREFVPSRKDLQKNPQNTAQIEDNLQAKVSQHFKYAEDQFYLESLDE
jgi:hypothetical protein